MPVAVPTLFTEITEQTGLFVAHDPGKHEEFPMPQIMGTGGGFIDANGDELLDIIVIPGATSNLSKTAHCALWLQTKGGVFEDHSESSGLTIGRYGMGLATGDVDNDGDHDLFVTTESDDHLFLNDGGGKFTDVTVAAGIIDPRWSTASSFVDYDADGWLDLLIVNYLDYYPGSVCQDPTGRRDYCGPATFSGTVDRLYRNSGLSNGTVKFEDVTVTSGLSTGTGKGLGVICSDLTGDQRVDFYIANDQEPNRLWVQQPDGTFHDEGALRGCAVDLNGLSQASMGTALGDVDRDGNADLFLTHLRGETNTLYRNYGQYFEDQTGASGLGSASLNFTGFGVGMVDIEHDGDLDCLVVNGRVMRSPLHHPVPADTHWGEYAEANQIFLNDGQGKFSQWEHSGEPLTSGQAISRALSLGDIDQDGDLDILVTQVAGKARLFRNDCSSGHWLQIRARTSGNIRDALGTRVAVHVGSQVFWGDLLTSTSYLSAHAPLIHLGIGESVAYDSIEVNWPSGSPRREVFSGGTCDHVVTLVQGTGTPQPEPKQ